MTGTTSNALLNARDLGGLQADPGGRTTAVGVLYRSAAPQPGDMPTTSFTAGPIRTVIDLRSPGETAALHPFATGDVVVHSLPLLEDHELRTVPRESLTEIYRALAGLGGRRLARVVTLAATERAPLLIHCAAGKDRTGVAVALLLAVAGVRRADIMADYLRTRQDLDAVLARLPGTARPHGEEDPGVAGSAYGVVPEALDTLLDLWEGHPGGVTGWLRAHGAEPEAAEQWTRRFTATGA